MQRLVDSTKDFFLQQWAALIRPSEGLWSGWTTIVALVLGPVIVGLGIWALFYPQKGEYGVVPLAGISLIGVAVILTGFVEAARRLPQAVTVAVRITAAVLFISMPVTFLIWTAISAGMISIPMMQMVSYSLVALLWL